MNDLEKILEKNFGFTQFRNGQENVITSILAGYSAAAIFPTGSGKSLCYQFSALQLPHLTLVVSPLLALIQDQLTFLLSHGISAASIDSSQTREESQAVMTGVRQGQIKILMVSVERLSNERFRQFVSQVDVSLLVVDEAHCISEWGHNFRPDYLKLAQYRHQFNINQVLLLTATATAKVVEDMASKFDIDKKNITSTGFYRSNLNLSVLGVQSFDKLECLVLWLKQRSNQAGIVYVTLQKTAIEVAKGLCEQGVNALPYHAGMKHQQRQEIQHSFMNSDKQVIVATIAFGMGIDKSDIRFVVHYDLPKSIEGYAQEIGRAGRDGKASDCLVLANTDNLTVLENFIYGETPEPEAISYVLEEIVKAYKANAVGTLPQWELVLKSLSFASNIRELSLKTLLVYLEMLDVIKPLYIYYAEYKFKFIKDRKQILALFDGERKDFVESVFNASKIAKTWASVDFDLLYQQSLGERSRAVMALDYLDQNGLIELQTKQMTQVFEVLKGGFDINALTSQLYQRFKSKEESEIKRIHNLMGFFESEVCLSKELSEYFSDRQVVSYCGHCSVCAGSIARLPAPPELTPLSQSNFKDSSQNILDTLGAKATPVLVSRFFCGLPTPLFTKIRPRLIKGFAQYENYHFSEVKEWVESMLK